MKISINLHDFAGPYGGGNQFKNSLAQYLLDRQHKVINHLRDHDIDVILMVSPLPEQSSATYSYLDVEYYLLRFPQTIVVHRVNYCGEARGDTKLTRRFCRANRSADYTVFISQWIRRHYYQSGFDRSKPSKVIYNGADTSIFNQNGGTEWQPGNKMRIVTHHWSNNPRKGFDIYKQLDNLLDDPTLANQFEFTYIGNLPKDEKFHNTRVLPTLPHALLAKELRSHHIYLTAARFEAAGMHHIEGANCGLPLLYRDEGALPEYCANFGLGFNDRDFISKLKEIQNRYSELRARMCDYPFNANRMNQQYSELFNNLRNVQINKTRTSSIVKLPWYWLRAHTTLPRIKRILSVSKHSILSFYSKSLHRQLLEKQIKRYSHLMRNRLLDIGSKNRRYDMFFPYAKEIVAIDKSPIPGNNIIRAEVEQLPFSSGSFESVICFEVLEYVINAQRALAEIRRVMKTDGILILSAPFLGPVHGDIDSVRYTYRGWELLLQNAGFAITDYQRIGGRQTTIWDFFFESARNSKNRLYRIAFFPFFVISRTIALRLDRRTREPRYYLDNFIVCRAVSKS